MKATYKRLLAAAFATVGLMSLGACQTNGSTTDLGVMSGSLPTLDSTSRPKIMINQTEVNFTDAQPGVINGQLMIPVRDVAEQLGATVEWLNQDKEVVIDLPSQQTVTLSTNPDWLDLIGTDDQVRPLRFYGGPELHLMLSGTEVVLIGDRAYMPFDQLATCINGSGNWDQSDGTATITIDQGTTGEDKQVPSGTGNPPPDDPTY